MRGRGKTGQEGGRPGERGELRRTSPGDQGTVVWCVTESANTGAVMSSSSSPLAPKNGCVPITVVKRCA